MDKQTAKFIINIEAEYKNTMNQLKIDRDYYEEALRKAEKRELNYLRDKERLDWLEKSDYELYDPNTDLLFSESSRAAIEEAMQQTATQ
jgi:hypothetical protein